MEITVRFEPWLNSPRQYYFRQFSPLIYIYCTVPGMLEPVGCNRVFAVDIYHLVLKLFYTHIY